MKYNRLNILFFCLLTALVSCTKEAEESYASVENYMLFGVEEAAQTKISYVDQTNGGISATFDNGDYIGLYAFYNNFYYYYTEYLSFAESVIFANQGLEIDGNGGATYSPLKSWTFSTIYGTAPHTLDCMAYYPFKEGYNPDYVNMVHSSDGAATLEYYYAYDEDEDGVYEVVNSNIDFMTAHTRYDDSETPDNFRSDMLSKSHIPLAFTRQTASLNLQVTKPDDYATEIIVKGVTVYFDAYRKFIHAADATSEVEWSDMTTGYSLVGSTTCNTTLAETGWDDIPDDGSSNEVENLLLDNNMLFFPPETDILKIVFTITDNAVETTYTWHPHVATIEANTHYTLSLELDPARAN